MKKHIYVISGFMLLCCLCFAVSAGPVQAAEAAGANAAAAADSADSGYEAWNDNLLIVDPYKSWTIKFSQPVDLQTATGDNIFVLGWDKTYAPIRIFSGNQADELVVDCPENGYESQEYTLYIGTGLKSNSGSPLTQGVMLRFFVMPD